MFRTLLLSLTLFLSGCDLFESRMTVSKICSEYPQMCTDLNPDDKCAKEKAEIITHRHEHFKKPSASGKYKLLMDFEDYKTCVTKAAMIEHKKLKEKKGGRIKGMMTAERELKRLAADTRGVNEPHLLYYHWSRFGDDEALKGFLRFMRAGKLETPELQVALATYHVKNDLNKTVKTLYHALELYKQDDEIDQEIFTSLSTIFMKQNKYDHAYIWAYIAKEYSEEQKINLAQIESVVKQSGGNISKLKDKADDYMDTLDDRKFVAPI